MQIAKNHKTVLLQCEQCPNIFFREIDFKNHKRRIHTGKYPYLYDSKGDKYVTCDICSKNYPSRTNLNIHMRTHTGERSFLCKHCPKAFSSQSSLETHVNVHTGKRPYKCNQCTKSYKQATHLSTHKRTHTGEKPYPCNQCPKAFNQSSHLKLHIKLHNGERAFPCDQCKMSFIENAKLQNHKRKHSGEKPYKCVNCSETFSQLVSLKRHTRMIHNIGKKFTCKFCQKPFPFSNLLHHHIKVKHEAIKNLPCEKCNELFTWKWELRKHSYTHIEQKEYKCNFCRKLFNKKHVFDLHQKRNWNKPLVCSKCMIHFESDDALSSHKLICGNLKCDQCDKLFHIKETLKSHLFKIHGTEYKCYKSTKLFQAKQSLVNENKLLTCLKCHSHWENKDTFLTHETDCKKHEYGQCNKVFTSNKLMEYHVFKVHEKKYECQNCTKSFTTEKSLRNHLKINKDKLVICKKCQTHFESNGTMSLHEMFCGKLKCDKCHKTFDKRKKLKSHFYGVHGEKFDCNKCKKSFRTKKNWIKHINKNINKQFVCSKCSTHYETNIESILHSRTYGQLTCDQCERTFISGKQLKRHYKVHTSENISAVNLAIKRQDILQKLMLF